MESSMEIPQKAKDRTAIGSSDTAPGHKSKGLYPGYNRDTCRMIFISQTMGTT
jgi:hypothetical protein